MRDGSDAVSDWPLLNALLNCASGATWVSLHHGGGVGMGYLAACRHGDRLRRHARPPPGGSERVLWNDPATGVMRHADAGYRDRHRLRPRVGPRSAVAGTRLTASCRAPLAAAVSPGCRCAGGR